MVVANFPSFMHSISGYLCNYFLNEVRTLYPLQYWLLQWGRPQADCQISEEVSCPGGEFATARALFSCLSLNLILGTEPITIELGVGDKSSSLTGNKVEYHFLPVHQFGQHVYFRFPWTSLNSHQLSHKAFLFPLSKSHMYVSIQSLLPKQSRTGSSWDFTLFASYEVSLCINYQLLSNNNTKKLVV